MDDLFGDNREDRFEEIALAWLKDSADAWFPETRLQIGERRKQAFRLAAPRHRENRMPKAKS